MDYRGRRSTAAARTSAGELVDAGSLPSRRRKPLLRHPAQVIAFAFAGAVLVGAVLLMLPVSRSGDGSASFITALFTAASAVCVTGLVTVDTATYWSGFGQVVILALIQVGGFGIMTMASLLGLLVSKRVGLKSRLTTSAETKSIGGNIRGVLIRVLIVTMLFESVTALLLTARFLMGYQEPLGRAAYFGLFHAVSAFNNAGFALYPDNLMRFAADLWICLPIAIAVIAGGLGFPVLLELRRVLLQPRCWSLHTKLTVSMTALLLVSATVLVTVGEWSNPRTLGGLDPGGRLLAGFFHGVMPRTAGFNSLDVGAMKETTWLGTIVLMFIGGGSAGTAGGIKVTTFVILFFAIYAEVRGESHVNAFDRRLDPRTIRQALAVALMSVAAVVFSTFLLLELTDYGLGPVLFEATSAFATVGMSTGITTGLPSAAEVVLIVLMFVGRIGPITLVSALALRERQRLYELPEGRPIIG